MAIEHPAIEREREEARTLIDHEVAVRAVADRQRYRFTAEQYHQMGEAGVFLPGDRVELIEGEIIAMNPIGDPHAGGVNRLTKLFVVRVGDAGVVGIQNPVRLARRSEPEPDLAILRYRDEI